MQSMYISNLSFYSVPYLFSIHLFPFGSSHLQYICRSYDRVWIFFNFRRRRKATLDITLSVRSRAISHVSAALVQTISLLAIFSFSSRNKVDKSCQMNDECSLSLQNIQVEAPRLDIGFSCMSLYNRPLPFLLPPVTLFKVRIYGPYLLSCVH